jgi:hexosaminidase
LQVGAGEFVVRDGARISAPAGDAEALFAATEAADLVRRTRGLDLRPTAGDTPGKPAEIRLALDPQAPVAEAEGYALDVAPSGITVRARDEAGLFYGAMTLAQLLSPDAEMGRPVRVPALEIRDRPRFAWRGMMLDTARHFLPPKSIEAFIDAMAAHKLNVLHLHLTDDQGWRIEIKRYPALTEVGAWRTPPGGKPGERYGGFYTQDQIRALVAYATARHVTIVPELDLPGHAQAVVAAYPDVGVTGKRPAVSTDWGVNPYLFNPDAKGLAFVDNVLDEVMGLFPSSFIHIGGDEAVKDQWQASPQVQAQMRALGVHSEDQLQSWFIEQIGRYLASKGRRLIGWDEILQGGLPPSASVMSWRGIQGAVDAARQGHDVVLSPAPTLYFDNLQSRRGDEQPGRLAVVTLADVYAFDPMPKVLGPEEQHHVLGAQANLWSEYLITPTEVAHAAFPRMDALAEVVWSPAGRRDWNDFLGRLPAQLARYSRLGINAADSAFAPDFTIAGGRNAALQAGRASMSLSNQARFGEIRYTLDGRAPGPDSPLYRAPFEAPLGAVIRAAAFTSQGQPLSAPRSFSLDAPSLRTLTSSELQACPREDLGLRVPLTPDATATAPAYDVNIFDSCWIYPKARLDGIAALKVSAARLARNYGLMHDQVKVVERASRSAIGELQVRLDGCDGPLIATTSLTDPSTDPARLDLVAAIPAVSGEHDLCLAFAAPIYGPLYAIDQVRLEPAAQAEVPPRRRGLR